MLFKARQSSHKATKRQLPAKTKVRPLQLSKGSSTSIKLPLFIYLLPIFSSVWISIMAAHSTLSQVRFLSFASSVWFPRKLNFSCSFSSLFDGCACFDVIFSFPLLFPSEVIAPSEDLCSRFVGLSFLNFWFWVWLFLVANFSKYGFCSRVLEIWYGFI